MKKSTLALSVAAALGGLGFVGNALAIGEITATATPRATSLELNADGLGHQLLVPYFTTQGDNATLLSIVNTDTVNGKVVKVRFRGAANSDDLFDFQVLMSPGDVWTGAVTQDAATGLSQLTTTDTTCVLPDFKASKALFSTLRTDPQASPLAAQTREGYVEVIAMADVPPYTAGTTQLDTLYETIKHGLVAGSAAPACDATVLEAKLGSDYTNHTTAISVTGGQMADPSGRLMGDWIILNQNNTAAWSGGATALQAQAAGANAYGNLVFWPQKFNPVAGNFPLCANDLDTACLTGGTDSLTNAVATADPLLTRKVVAIQQYDLPDLSTPYTTNGAANAAALQADRTTSELAVNTVSNQFVTSADLKATTDFLFSQPARRYAAAVNYRATTGTSGSATATTGTSAVELFRVSPVTPSAYYTTVNTGMYTRQLCLDTIYQPNINGLFDREEKTPGTGPTPPFVISPNIPGAVDVFLICGEAAIGTIINQDTGVVASALSASVAQTNVGFKGYANGWMRWDLPGNSNLGLPILGSSFIRASNGVVNYGFAYGHKVTRPLAP